jgi:hypothetical protein
VPATSPEDVARLLSAAEAKHASKIADLKKNLAAVEKERNEGEADWSLKLRRENEGNGRVEDDFTVISEDSGRERGSC